MGFDIASIYYFAASKSFYLMWNSLVSSYYFFNAEDTEEGAEERRVFGVEFLLVPRQFLDVGDIKTLAVQSIL